MTQPFISIIIVNWNGCKWLEKCLKSLENQTYERYEVILVDNASTDGSVAYVQKHFSWVQIVETGTNIGFAGGNNVGLQYTKGDYILLLNNDTYVPADFIEKFIKIFDEIPTAGAAQSKLVLMDDQTKLDVCGSFWTHSTFLYHYGFAQAASEIRFSYPIRVFSNKGASLLIKRDVIDKIGLFDDDFWCYYEETDFCHRVWLAGYECWYYPTTTCFHAMGGTSMLFKNDYVQFHNLKNKLCSFIKNFSIYSLFWVVPTYVLINIFLSCLWFLQGKWGLAFAPFRAILWNIRNGTRTLKKRRFVQELRVGSDTKILRHVTCDPQLKYYYHLVMGLGTYVDSLTIQNKP